MNSYKLYTASLQYLKFIFCGLVTSCSLIHAALDLLPPLEFVFVVPSYNNEKWVVRNLDGLTHQRTSVPYSIICVDDCSTDKTGKIMDDYASDHNLDPSFLRIIHNKKRRGALANIYHTIHEQCKDHQIVVLCDGDDVIAHNLVLDKLAKEYADPNLWMTYGQFIFYPSGKWGTTYEIPRESLEKREVRSLVYVAQHLRTFKAGLFKKIHKDDLMLNGEFFSVNADMATMIPMLEMCAPKDAHSPNHSKFIPDIVYIYNYDNPLGDERIHRQLQLDLEKIIRSKRPYEPLDKL